jgi:hypothetical protein
MISPVTLTPLPIVRNGYGEELARLGGGRDLSRGKNKAMYVISNLPPAFDQSAIDRFHENRPRARPHIETTIRRYNQRQRPADTRYHRLLLQRRELLR